MYMEYLAEHGYSDSNYTAQSLGSKLLKHFQGKISMDKANKRQGNVLYSSKIETPDTFRNVLEQVLNKETKIVEVALHLRSLILDTKNNTVDFPFLL